MDLRLVEPAGDEAAFLELEGLASEPYSAFVYRDAAQAAQVRGLSFEKKVGEFSPPLAKAVVNERGELVAMVAGPIGHAELQRARMLAARALHASALLEGQGEVLARMQLARGTLLTLRAGDQYLSRIAVHPRLRGKGVGRFVLDAFLADARARGGVRAVLEVSPAHPGAIRLYESAGFETLEERRVEDPASRRTLVYRHMARALG